MIAKLEDSSLLTKRFYFLDLHFQTILSLFWRKALQDRVRRIHGNCVMKLRYLEGNLSV